MTYIEHVNHSFNGIFIIISFMSYFLQGAEKVPGPKLNLNLLDL